ncbi:MAG: GTP-binding protein [Pseudomonadota bacterium]|nr:GTP-binding protein [Pseudomonadota bacterium]
MVTVSILTGFLGSGKTTLLSRLLRHADMAKTAVIINEFGTVGLDHILVEASDENIIELNNGCLCCTIRGDLVLTLLDLLGQRDRGEVMAFERIVIETTGLADPVPILQALMTDTALAGDIEVDGVVTTVDAVTGAATLDRHPEAVKQAAIADRIVLTKTDMPEAEDLRARLSAVSPAACLLTAIKGDIAPNRLFDNGVFDPSAKPANVQAWLDAERHTHDHAHDVNRHGDGITAHAMVLETPIHAIALTLFLEILAEHCGADLLRMKGLVKLVESTDRPAVVHGVQNVFHPPVWLECWPGEDRNSKLVFITKDLPGQWFEDLLLAINAEVAEAHERQN